MQNKILIVLCVYAWPLELTFYNFFTLLTSFEGDKIQLYVRTFQFNAILKRRLLKSIKCHKAGWPYTLWQLHKCPQHIDHIEFGLSNPTQASPKFLSWNDISPSVWNPSNPKARPKLENWPKETRKSVRKWVCVCNIGMCALRVHTRVHLSRRRPSTPFPAHLSRWDGKWTSEGGPRPAARAAVRKDAS